MKYMLNIMLVLLFLGCSESGNKEGSESHEEMKKVNVDYLVFEFHDSSVPPPYHRSYSMEFRDDKVKILVDSYGDILTDTILVLGKEEVEKAFSFIHKYQVQSRNKNEENEGCTGGTGISISYGADETETCSGYVYFCAGEQFGDLSGDLEGLKNSLKELIPNFNQYLKED